MKGPWILPIIVASLAALLVAAMGATITDLGPWYQSLVKPGWTPPDELVPIVWTLVYAAITVAAVDAWRAAPNAVVSQTLVGLFALNAILNIAWSVAFFRLQRPDWALYLLGALWLSTLVTAFYCSRFSRSAGLWLAPYLIWLTVFAVLNWQIAELNAPFA